MNSDSVSDEDAQVTQGDTTAHLGGPLPQASVPRQPAGADPTAPAPPRTPPTSGWRYTFSSLAVRDFRVLWLGLVFMMGAMQMAGLAVGYLVYELTSSAFRLGVVEAGAGLSILAFALFGGALADRVERRVLIQLGQAAAALVSLLIALAIVSDTITWVHLLVALIFEGAFFSFLMPARHAIVPQLVAPDKVTNAMALNAAAMGSTAMLAPAAAGTLYALIGPGGLFFVITGMEVIALMLTGLVPRLPIDSTKPRAPIIQEIKAGLSHILQSRLLLVLMFMGLAATMLSFPFRVLLPVFVVDLYHRGPESLGLLMAMMGAGALTGSLFIASIGTWRRGLILILGGFVTATGLLLASLIPVYFVAVGIMLLIGLGDSGRRALNQALVMEQVEDQYRGRVISVFMMSFGLMPLGVLPIALIAEVWHPQFAIGILAVLMFATSTTILITQKRLRTLQ